MSFSKRHFFFFLGCPKYETCDDAELKRCPDGVTAAKGAGNEVYQTDACKTSLYGCCPDGFTASEGSYGEGCPVPTTPAPSTTPSTDEEFLPVACKESEFGCCPDQMTPATGPSNEGCFVCESDMDGSGSGRGSGAMEECDSCDDTNRLLSRQSACR